MLEQNVVNISQVTQRVSDSESHKQFLALQSTFMSQVTKTYEWRIEQLSQLQKMTEENKALIEQALFADLGKCKTEAWLTEAGFLISDIKDTKKRLKKWMKSQKRPMPMLAQPGSSYVKAEPLGTVLIIGAWNYPFQLTLAPLIAAIAAGNCAIVKPSELAPAISSLIAELLPKYLDQSAFAVVEGAKDETTELLTFPFDKIFYTGGEQVGKIVMAAAAKHLTPVTLELGGKSPCVIDGKTNLEVAARRIVWGKMMNLGQTCVAPDYVLIEKEYQDKFIEILIKTYKEQYGECRKDNKDIGRIINRRHAERLASYIEGQEIVFGGEVDLDNRFVQPTIIKNPALDSIIMNEEIFGPLLPVVALDNKHQLIDFVRQRPKPLAAYLFTEDKSFEQAFVDQVSSGSLCINDTSIFMASHDLPFGGVGTSGMGAYHGKAGFDTFSHSKAVMRRSYKLDASIRYAPFSKFKLSILKLIN
jgi:aldehyde dehydrogenase (NAD+)